MLPNALKTLLLVTSFSLAACGAISPPAEDASPGDVAVADAAVADASDAAAPDAAPRAPHAAEVDQIMAPLVRDRWIHGAVVATVDPDGVNFFAYGRANAGDPAPPTADSLFEIGSITKTFTGLLLAQRSLASGLALETEAQTLLPDGVRMPSRGARAINLLDIVTHRSGLPRDTVYPPAPDPRAPFDGWSAEGLYAFIDGYALTREPGAMYEYSNIGFGLLGNLLGRHARSTYAAALQRDVLEPLGLRDTTAAPDAAQLARLVQGYDADANEMPHWRLPGMESAGAILSSPRDMARYVQHQVALQESALAPAVALSQQRRNALGGPFDIAMAWNMRRSQPGNYFHTGRTGGYDTFAGFDTVRRVGVVVLANNVTGLSSGLLDTGHALLDALRGLPARPLNLAPVVEVPPTVFADYVGLYGNATDGFLQVDVIDGQLYLVADEPMRLWPESPTRYQLRVWSMRADFTVDASGAATMLTLRAGDGSSYRLPRE